MQAEGQLSPSRLSKVECAVGGAGPCRHWGSAERLCQGPSRVSAAGEGRSLSLLCFRDAPNNFSIFFFSVISFFFFFFRSPLVFLTTSGTLYIQLNISAAA